MIVANISIHNQIIRKVILLHVPILFCLLILTDHETNYSSFDESGNNHTSPKRHLAIFTALSRHPPSMRVYRGLFGLILLAFCSSLSLFVWERIVDKKIIANLMFRCPYTLVDNNKEYIHNENNNYCAYEPADGVDDSDNDNNDEKDNDNNENGEAVNCDSNQTNHMEDIPSSMFVLSKSLDSLLLFLISLFLFTISSSAGGQYIDQTKKNNNISIDNGNTMQFDLFSYISSIAAPIFPLALFLFFVVKMFLPWNKSRCYFWTCITYTLGAPFYDVSFRDGFIGDILTSMVRPMQDLAFTTFYLFSGLQGWWIYRNDSINSTTTLEEDVVLQPVEHSWLLHTIILPACMVSPLWWRFSQTLRQCYDTKNRWPYLGNSLKYFLAAQVVILGVFFEPQKKNHFSIWVVLYVFATVYQILWDIFMDWEMFSWKIRDNRFELRKNRLYSSKSVYVAIMVLNIILRFGWILNFIPMQYLSQTTGVLEYTFSADFSTFVSPLLACAEIIRRTLWGFLRFELEALKTVKEDECKLTGAIHDGVDGNKAQDMENDDGIEMMKPMSIETAINNANNSFSFKSLSSITFWNDLSTTSDIQILWELCVYETIFLLTGIVAGIHRQVL